LDGKLSALDGKLSALDGKLTSLDGKLSTLDGRLTSFDGKLSASFNASDGVLLREVGIFIAYVNCKKITSGIYADNHVSVFFCCLPNTKIHP
jgi:hypothetical protein